MNGHEGHVRYIGVDDNDVLYESCHFPGGETMCGDANVIGRVSSTRAEAVRRAARAYRAGEATRGLPRTSRGPS